MSAPGTTSRGTVDADSVGAVRDAVLDHPGPVLAAGAGTARTWGGRPPADALEVSMRGLRGIVTHNPGDMTVSVRAGTPLEELQAEVGAHGQRIAADPARAGRGATVGGLFATADAGPLALIYGTMRDLVIGATVVLADGTVARTGGHVIKNVAGYDLAKLLHGAHGTLALVVELVLRLHPTPASTATLAVDRPLADLTGLGHEIAALPVEVTALEWVDAGAGTDGRLLARIEGTADGVRGRIGRLRDAVGGEVLDTAGESDAWAGHAAAVDTRPTDRAVLRLGVAPSRLVGVLGQLRADAGAAGITAAPATGVATLTVPADAAAVGTAHELVAAAGGTSSLRHRPESADLPAWYPSPSSAALLRAVAAAFDPDQRLGRGRLAPWLPDPTGVSA